MIIRLVRAFPLIVALAILALVVYVFVSYWHSSVRAKSVLIKLFVGVGAVLSGFFGLVCLYAAFENNGTVLDLMLGFFAVAVLTLVIALLCRSVFLKNHPNYRKKPVRTRRMDAKNSERK